MSIAQFFELLAARCTVLRFSFAMMFVLVAPFATAQSPQSAVVAPPTAAPESTSVTVPLLVLARGYGGITITNLDILSEVQKTPEEARRAALSKT